MSESPLSWFPSPQQVVDWACKKSQPNQKQIRKICTKAGELAEQVSKGIEVPGLEKEIFQGASCNIDGRPARLVTLHEPETNKAVRIYLPESHGKIIYGEGFKDIELNYKKTPRTMKINGNSMEAQTAGFDELLPEGKREEALTGKINATTAPLGLWIHQQYPIVG